MDSLLCSVNSFIYEDDITWLRDGKKVTKIGEYKGKSFHSFWLEFSTHHLSPHFFLYERRRRGYKSKQGK